MPRNARARFLTLLSRATLTPHVRLLRAALARTSDRRLAAPALGILFVAIYARGLYAVFPLLDWYKVGHAGFATISHFDNLTAVGLAAAGLALLLIGRGMWALARERPSTARLAVILLAWLGASAFLIYTQPGQSTDLFDYQFRAHMLVHLGKNPVVTPPSDLITFEQFPFLSWYWEADPYGPIWLGLSGGLHALIGEDLLSNILMFKVLATIATGTSGALIYAILRRAAPEHALAGLAFWLLNPLVLNEGALHGHNDLVMVSFMLAGVWLLGRARPSAGVLLLTAAGLVKVSGWVVLPVAVLWVVRERGWRAGMRQLLPGLVVSVGIVLVSYLPFGGVEKLVAAIQYRGWWSTNTWTNAALVMLTNAGWTQEMAIQWVMPTQTAVFIILAGLLMWRIRDLRTAAFAVMLAYVLVDSNWFQPWYLVWALALAATITDTRLIAYAHLLTAFMLVQPILSQFYAAQNFHPPEYDLLMAAATLLVPQLIGLWFMLHAIRIPLLTLFKQPRTLGAHQ